MTYHLTQQHCCAVDVTDEKGRGTQGGARSASAPQFAVAHPPIA
jgi:hypothetical protein